MAIRKFRVIDLNFYLFVAFDTEIFNDSLVRGRAGQGRRWRGRPEGGGSAAGRRRRQVHEDGLLYGRSRGRLGQAGREEGRRVRAAGELHEQHGGRALGQDFLVVGNVLAGSSFPRPNKFETVINFEEVLVL